MKDCIYSQSLCRLYVKRVVSNKKRSTRDYTDERIPEDVLKKSYQIAVPKQYMMLTEEAALAVPLMKKKVDLLMTIEDQ